MNFRANHFSTESMSIETELLQSSKQLHTVRRRSYTQRRVNPTTYTDGSNEEVL
jgi:hypothetical protein